MSLAISPSKPPAKGLHAGQDDSARERERERKYEKFIQALYISDRQVSNILLLVHRVAIYQVQ